MRIPFNKPFMTGAELHYMTEAHSSGHLSGDGAYTKKCHAWLERRLDSYKALLTHSCTAALEMAAILSEIQPGDEIIMPSYTFVSTANAFARQGAVPVFVDIRADTLNIDETKIEAAITSRTKAIVPVHYAGVACEMDAIMNFAKKYELLVIEDAAQAVFSTYMGQPLGAIGDLGTLSFHETKNIISGEGGALLVNNPNLASRAEIIREKGTNRKAYFRGEVDKYSWVDIGSSFLPSDLIAAYLWAQMEGADDITRRRLAIWQTYHQAFETLEIQGLCRRPFIPDHCCHNAHMYYLLLPSAEKRTIFISKLKEKGIHSVFHYVPLHSSLKGGEIGKVSGDMINTDSLSARLVRLPFWLGIEEYLPEIIDQVHDAAIGV